MVNSLLMAEEPIPIVILKIFRFFSMPETNVHNWIIYNLPNSIRVICETVFEQYRARQNRPTTVFNDADGTLSEIRPSRGFGNGVAILMSLRRIVYRTAKPHRAPSRPFDKPNRAGSRLICATTTACAPTGHDDVTSAYDFESPLRSSPVALRRTFISRIIRLKWLRRCETNEKPNNVNYTRTIYRVGPCFGIIPLVQSPATDNTCPRHIFPY